MEMWKTFMALRFMSWGSWFRRASRYSTWHS